MSNFEKWFKTTVAYKMLEEQNYFKMDLFFFVSARNQYRHSGVQVAYMTWQHQQAIIDQLNSVLGERTKEWLQAIEIGTYFENAAKPLKEENDRLKAQLNDMEACYVEKKKEVEAVKHQKSLQELEISQISQANQEWQKINGELAKALRGAND